MRRIDTYQVKAGVYCVTISHGYAFEQYYFRSVMKLNMFLKELL